MANYAIGERRREGITGAKGTKLHAKEAAETGRAFQEDDKPTGNKTTPSMTTGPKPTSAAALEAALQTLMGIGGPEAYEGFHPPGRK